ncbi:mechanosensitive ion channel family protein [Labilibacter marinus]|uniref:mechanosensitive ion channel family protein n=1 Tax=Labilibacter marinus TaxID=1477105 RepID=UPI00094F4E07|nr:mechanosensitive ion channel family protein [Labilibacter marinus]
MEQYYTLIKIVTVVLLAVIANFILRKLIKLIMTKYAKKISADATSFSFLKNSAGFILFIVVSVYIVQQVPSLKHIGTALFAGAGILAAIVGFAAQKAFGNIVSGIFIIIFRPFRVGDIIAIGNLYKGVVEEITLRHIVIRDYENRRIIIPNGIISEETIVNSSISDVKIKKHIEFRIDFNSDVDLAMEILKRETENHSLTLDMRTPEQIEKGSPKVMVRLITIEEYAYRIRAWVWTNNNDDAFTISCDLNECIPKLFKAQNISIPYPHQTLIINPQ